jgi:hypothetical protein
MNKICNILLIYILFNIQLYGTTITKVNWSPDDKFIEVLLDQFPSNWGNWKFYLNGNIVEMEGGVGNIVVRPNAPLIMPPTGLIIATEPWVTSLENVNFPCCGTIQFYIPEIGYTNIFQYNFADYNCKTLSDTICQSDIISQPSWINHTGDLHFYGVDTTIIKGVNYFQSGNIYIESNASLIIKNTNLKIGRGNVPTLHVYIFVEPNAYLKIDSSTVFPDDGLVCVINRGKTEIIDSPTSIHYFDMSDGADLIMKNSRMVFTIGGLLQVTGGHSYVENSTIGALSLTVPANAHLTVDNLKSGTFFNSWDVHEIIPDANYELEMKNSYILKDDFQGDLAHGPYERGWIFSLDPTSHVRISNSELRKVFINIVNGNVTFENLKIGKPSSLSYNDIQLNNITMTGQWPFEVQNSTLTLRNSDYLFLQPGGEAVLNIENSHICELIPRDFSGSINFKDGSWTIAGEFIGGAAYHSNFNDFLITGSLSIGDMLKNSLQWKKAKVTREFDIIINDHGSDLFSFQVDGKQYYKNAEGKYILPFEFDETNYLVGKPFSLLKNGQVVKQDSINFFIRTPIYFSNNTLLPEIPLLLKPINGIFNVPLAITLTWSTSDEAESFELIVDDNIDFNSPLYSQSGINKTSQEINNLNSNATYYWKVRTINVIGESNWSQIWHFTTNNVTSRIDLQTEKYIDIYPNPFGDELIISFKPNNNKTVNSLTIYNSNGITLFKKVFTRFVDESTFRISTVDWKAGLYILKIESNNNFEVIKMIHQ